jgi:hypothetical protein
LPKRVAGLTDMLHSTTYAKYTIETA